MTPEMKENDPMAWMDSPKIAALATALGAVDVTFSAGGQAFVTTNAHVNDDTPTIAYKGHEYLINVHLYADLGWNDRVVGSHSTVQRRVGYADAAPTHRVAILEALGDAVREYVQEHPEVLRAAEYADANNDANRLEAEAAKVAAQLKDLRARARKLRARQARYAPPASSSEV